MSKSSTPNDTLWIAKRQKVRKPTKMVSSTMKVIEIAISYNIVISALIISHSYLGLETYRRKHVTGLLARSICCVGCHGVDWTPQCIQSSWRQWPVTKCGSLQHSKKSIQQKHTSIHLYAFPDSRLLQLVSTTPRQSTTLFLNGRSVHFEELKRSA